MGEGQPKIWPVILSGGSGTRLWPKSRTLFPKQFHVLTSEHSLLQEALLRVKDDSVYANPMVICNEEHRFIVAEQADELGIELQDIVLEPEGRNTAEPQRHAIKRVFCGLHCFGPISRVFESPPPPLRRVLYVVPVLIGC